MRINRESFDSRLLSLGAIGICVGLVAAFLSVARPSTTAEAVQGANRTPAAAKAAVYDEATPSRWPTS